MLNYEPRSRPTLALRVAWQLPMSKHASESPLDHLSRLRSQLPGRQRRLAEFIIDHRRELLGVSSKLLASMAGVSESTVSRLVRLLGYSGFADFSRGVIDHLRGELDSAGWLTVPLGASLNEAFARIIESETRQLERLAEEFPVSRLAAAVALLSEAQQVFVIGGQSSGPLALSLAYELGKVRDNVHRIRLNEEDAAHALGDATPKDVALAFGLPRYPRRVMDALVVLRRRQVPVVAITHADASPVARFATVSLPINLRYYMLTTGYSPASALLSALVVGVYQANPQRSRSRIEEFERTASTTSVFTPLS